MTLSQKLGIVSVSSLAGILVGVWLGRKFKENEKKPENFIDVLFFPDMRELKSAPFHQNNDSQDIFHSGPAFSKMIEYISSAKKSLLICMYQFTSYDLGTVVLQAIRRGVQVRLLCNHDCETALGSQVGRLREAAAFVRSKDQQYIMHHKFVVVDNHVVLTGSFNWTTAAATGNRENVIVTNDVITVNKFVGEFERLWTEFQP